MTQNCIYFVQYFRFEAITVEKCKTKRAKKTKSELKNNAKVTIKSPKCSDKNHLETDNIEGNTASQKKGKFNC